MISHLARVPSMQSAANFMSGKGGRHHVLRGLGPGLVAVALILLSGRTGRCEDAPPAPSPTPAPAAGPGAGVSDNKPARGVFGTIMGTIFDVKKRPLSGWMVQLSSRGEDSLLRVTGTNENGQYVFKDLPAGTYDIEVQAASEEHKKGRIEVRPPFRNIVDFQIDPGTPEKPNPLQGIAPKTSGSTGPENAAAPVEAPAVVGVRGLFVDAQKRPVSEVSVTLVSLEKEAIAFQSFSDDEGSFAIQAVPPGRYHVLVFSPGYVPIDLKSIEVRPAAGLNLRLSLVDYPLNTKERPEERLPREEPIPAPEPSPAPTSAPS